MQTQLLKPVPTLAGRRGLLSGYGPNLTMLTMLLLNLFILTLAGNVPKVQAGESVKWNVPYLHQLFDTQDGFNGSGACGPTSAVMALAGYGRVDAHYMATSKKQGVTGNNWGWYVSNIFTSKYQYGNQYQTFNAPFPDNSGRNAYGAYGWVVGPNGAEWYWMADFLRRNGLSVTQDADFTMRNTEALKSRLRAGQLVLLGNGLTSAGHVVLVIGFNDNGVIVNDPYGNAYKADGTRDPEYGYHHNGAGVVYPWSFLNLTQSSITINTALTPPPPAQCSDLVGNGAPGDGLWLFINAYNALGHIPQVGCPQALVQQVISTENGRIGYVQYYNNGAHGANLLTYDSQTRQVIEVRGGIYNYYMSWGGIAGSKLGFPTEFERVAGTSRFGTTGSVQAFQQGAVHWNSRLNQSFYTVNGIYQIYLNLKGTSGALGFPTSNEYAIANGWKSDFEGGWIEYYNDATSKVIYK